MDANAIMQAVSNLGFPVVMVLIMAWYIYKQQSELTAAVNQLTVMIEKLTARLDEIEKERRGADDVQGD
jgi:hypothetical protein